MSKLALGVLIVAVGFSALLPLDKFIDGPPEHVKLLPAKQSTQAPDFTLAEMNTPNTVSLLDEAKHQPVVFAFWATYCEACETELPRLDRIATRYAGRVSVFAVNSDDTPKAMQTYARQHKLSLRMLSDSAKQAKARYNIDALPRLFVVDSHGVVRAVVDGDNPSAEADLPPILDLLLRESASNESANGVKRAGNT